MAGYSTSNSSGSSTPASVDSAQSDWGMQLSQMLSALGQSQYNWARGEFNKGMQVTDQNINNFMQLSGQGSGLAQNLLSRYQNVFEPLMDRYIQQAGSYNSADRQRFMAGQAESTTAQADQAARDQAERQLQSFGINPNSGRYQDLMLTSRVQDAAARAGAGTLAAQHTADIGRQMEEKAVQMGQNVPGMTVNALNSAYQGVTGAQNAELGMLNTGAALTGSAAPFLNAAGSANKLPPVGNTSAQQSKAQSVTQPNQPSQQGDKQGSGNRGGQQPKDPGMDKTGPGFNPQHGGVGKQEFLQPPKDAKAGTGEDVYDPFEQYKMAGVDPFNPDTFKPTDTGQLPSWLGDAQQPANTQSPQDAPFQDNPGFQPNPNSTTNEFRPPDIQSWSQPTQQQSQNPWDNVGTQGNFGQLPGGQNIQQNDPFGEFSQNFGDQGPQQDYNPFEDFQQLDQGPQQDWSQMDQGPQQDYGSYQGGGQGGWDQPSEDNGDYGGSYGSYAKGGKVGRGVLPTGQSNRTTGGPVPRSASPSQGQQTDDIPARLNAGEFVIPKDVVGHFGTKHFQDLITKSRKMRTGMAGPPAKPTMKPAMRMRPTFQSNRI